MNRQTPGSKPLAGLRHSVSVTMLYSLTRKWALDPVTFPRCLAAGRPGGSGGQGQEAERWSQDVSPLTHHCGDAHGGGPAPGRHRVPAESFFVTGSSWAEVTRLPGFGVRERLATEA